MKNIMTDYVGLAPIVLFVYNRPLHTKKTIDALKQNLLAEESDIFIYSDAPKNIEAEEKVKDVRAIINNIQGFKTVTVIEREENWGLANSIIDGVTSIVNNYGKVIVLEDDIVASPYFLKFMNDALNFYEYNKKVWHISGWNYPIDLGIDTDVFFHTVMNCWGWATWSDRWSYYEKNPYELKENLNRADKKKFDLDGSGVLWCQVEGNISGRINTWAIFWYATIFLNRGVCLNPTISFVENCGFDGSGIHCGETSLYKQGFLNKKENIIFENEINIRNDVVEKIKNFYKSEKKPFYIRLMNKISRVIFSKNFVD